ncbi:MAG: phage minor head protein [Candidatus Cloacimonadaceae bacterium]|nr:phage minor head protein [Candidatus Cloacimonadaceae bacterium]
MQYYDQIMLEYYRVLNNAWKTEVKDAAYLAIQMLSDMPRSEKVSKTQIDKLMDIINTQLGDDFASQVNDPTKAYIDRCIRLGLRDTQVSAPVKTSIGLWGIEDQHLSSTIQKHQLFWLGNHFDADIRQNFADVLSKAIEQGYTKEMLTETLKQQFSDIGEKSQAYWQGLAEHTALRIREFGRLQGYKKAQAKYYKLVVILDDRTSDICRALAAQDKVYPLNDATEVMDNLMALDTKSDSLDDARDYIKALAPWVSNDQIVYNNQDEPVGVSGSHTPFPPFHWKCRTATVLIQ